MFLGLTDNSLKIEVRGLQLKIKAINQCWYDLFKIAFILEVHKNSDHSKLKNNYIYKFHM